MPTHPPTHSHSHTSTRIRTHLVGTGAHGVTEAWAIVPVAAFRPGVDDSGAAWHQSLLLCKRQSREVEVGTHLTVVCACAWVY